MGKSAQRVKQGFSADRLRRIDRFIDEKYVATGRLPCAQLVIARRGEVVHETVLGKRDLERGLPAEADTLYRIYSMTKPITSVAFMMLVEEGKVALDDPVERYIPAWKDLGVYAAGSLGAFATTRA
jgi:CubicO group peptidase (beta-lactamase class C family)